LRIADCGLRIADCGFQHFSISAFPPWLRGVSDEFQLLIQALGGNRGGGDWPDIS